MITQLLEDHANAQEWRPTVRTDDGAPADAAAAPVVVLDRPDLLRVARLGTSPGAVVVTAGPLAADRPAGAAYVCRGSVCEAPTTDADRLAAQLQVVVGP